MLPSKSSTKPVMPIPTLSMICQSFLNPLMPQRKLWTRLNWRKFSFKNLQWLKKWFWSDLKKIQPCPKGLQWCWENAFTDAKKKLNAAEPTLGDANTAKNFAYDEYFAAALGLEDTRNQLENATRRKALTDLAVQDAKDALDTAIQARDNAQNELTKADDILAKA